MLKILPGRANAGQLKHVTRNTGFSYLALQQLQQSPLFHSVLSGLSFSVEGYQLGIRARIMPVFHRSIRNIAIRV